MVAGVELKKILFVMEWITNVSDLNESALGLVENNDPSVSGLIISKSNWIKRAGQAIGDSKSLRLLKTKVLLSRKKKIHIKWQKLTKLSLTLDFNNTA